jgi:hypothetical protein
MENWLDNLSTPIEAAIEWGIEAAIQEAIEATTGAPIETQEIVHITAQGRLFIDDRAEENYDDQKDDDYQEDIEIIRGRIDLSEAGSQDENNSQDEDNDQQNDDNNGDENGNSQEDDKSQVDDNISDSDVDEQDTESTNSEESDDAINKEAGLGLVVITNQATHKNDNDEEADIFEDSDLDVDEDYLEPMSPEDMEDTFNEAGGYALVYSANQADNQEPAQSEPQQRIRIPLGEISPLQLRQINNRNQPQEEIQPADPNTIAVRTQRVRIFLRHNMFRIKEEPTNEEEEEMQDVMRDFQVQQLAEEAEPEPEPQPLRRSERIRRRGERQQQEQNEEERENLPPHAGPQNLNPVEINGQEFDHQPHRWIFNGTFQSMNWNFMSDVMRD